MKNRYLFVYGTLRKDVGHEMYHVLARHAVFVNAGTVQGELYGLGEYPGLVHRHGTSDVVKGEVYKVATKALEQTLAILDDYEGLGPADPLPHEYRRELVPVTLGDGRGLHAWAYVLNRSPEGLERIPSGDFAEWRKSGGAQHGLQPTAGCLNRFAAAAAEAWRQADLDDRKVVVRMWDNSEALRGFSHGLMWASASLAILAAVATGLRYYIDRRVGELSAAARLVEQKSRDAAEVAREARLRDELRVTELRLQESETLARSAERTADELVKGAAHED